MRLVTIQPYEVLEILQSRGRFTCNIPESGMIVGEDYGFLAAYDWLVSQMEKRVGTAPIGVEYPICGIATTMITRTGTRMVVNMTKSPSISTLLGCY